MFCFVFMNVFGKILFYKFLYIEKLYRDRDLIIWIKMISNKYYRKYD